MPAPPALRAGPQGAAGGAAGEGPPGPFFPEEGAHQQSVGAVHGDAAREGVVDGQLADVGGRVVAALLVQVPRQVEVNRVLAHQLLPHVPQLHALQVCRLETQCKLGRETGVRSPGRPTPAGAPPGGRPGAPRKVLCYSRPLGQIGCSLLRGSGARAFLAQGDEALRVTGCGKALTGKEGLKGPGAPPPPFPASSLPVLRGRELQANVFGGEEALGGQGQMPEAP